MPGLVALVTMIVITLIYARDLGAKTLGTYWAFYLGGFVLTMIPLLYWLGIILMLGTPVFLYFRVKA